MKSYYSTLLLSVIFAASCNGQDNAKQKNTGEYISQNISPRIVKTQGSNEYASLSSGMQDKAGNLWFTTSAEGIYRYTPSEGNTGSGSFTNYTEKDGLCSNSASSIIEDRAGNIWIGTNAGLCRYRGNKFTNIPFSAPIGGNFIPAAKKVSANIATGVRCVFEDSKGNIWVATQTDGVYFSSAASALGNMPSFTHFLKNDGVENKNGLVLNAVCNIIEDRNGNIWFTTWFEGVCKYDGKAITNFKPNKEVWYCGLLEDKAGNIWVGRRGNGVCRYDGKTFTNVLQHGIMDSCCIYAIKEDKAGNIWFAAEADEMTKRETLGGAWRYDPTSAPGSPAEFTNFTLRDGLSNAAVFCITVDKSGSLWFGTRNTGLCRYDPTAAVMPGTKAFTDYTDRTGR